jgi:hypothetical protein
MFRQDGVSRIGYLDMHEYVGDIMQLVTHISYAVQLSQSSERIAVPSYLNTRRVSERQCTGLLRPCCHGFDTLRCEA